MHVVHFDVGCGDGLVLLGGLGEEFLLECYFLLELLVSVEILSS